MRLGDLDALKQTFAEYGEKAKFTQGACQQLIDNAETVTPTFEKTSYDMGYAMGYQDGAEDGLQGIRPEGKWIYHRAKGDFSPYMECDNCHEEFSLNMLRPAEFRKVNRFCLNCGADMKGGTE